MALIIDTTQLHSRLRKVAGLITWEFPRLCRGGSRSLTYTAVVLQEACDGLKTVMLRGGEAVHKS